MIRFTLIAVTLTGIALYGSGYSRTPITALPVAEPITPPTPLGESFDIGKTGTVTGQIRWEGPLPQVAGFRTPRLLLGKATWLEADNPLAPRIEPKSQGLAGVLVEIRGIAPQASRPWPHGRATVVLRDRQIVIEQDQRSAGVFGIVRRGESITIVSQQLILEALRARGAAFFTQAIPEANRLIERRLDQVGLVELSSGVGHFWARAYLAVRDHPYVTITDQAGRFTIPEVPSGDYEMIATLTNWRIAKEERDPELMWLMRQEYERPIVKTTGVQVIAGQVREVGMSLTK